MYVHARPRSLGASWGLLPIGGELSVLNMMRAFEEPERRRRRSSSEAMKLTPTMTLSHWWETLQQGCTKK